MSTRPIFINSVTNKAEWDRAWDALKAHWRGDHADYNPAYSECWQYMGTELRADTWEHVFRHRMHPRTKRREYHRVVASPAFHATHAIPADPVPAYEQRKPVSRSSCDLPPSFIEGLNGAFDGITVTSDADSGL